jgi:hypothetical protein
MQPSASPYLGNNLATAQAQSGNVLGMMSPGSNGPPGVPGHSNGSPSNDHNGAFAQQLP